MELKVIGTGLGRTGTKSLKFALEHLLKEPSFHMVELLQDTKRLKYFQELSKTGDTNWHQLFEGFSSAVDYPICLYYEELLKWNPNLKVIHTKRDPESWYDSVYNTIYRGVPKGPKDILRLMFNAIRSKDVRKVAPVFRHADKIIWQGQFNSRFEDKAYAIEVYLKHQEKVAQTVPKEQLLIYEVTEGWAPLCDFLNLPLPTIPFPRSNQKKEFNQKMDKLLINGVLEF